MPMKVLMLLETLFELLDLASFDLDFFFDRAADLFVDLLDERDM